MFRAVQLLTSVLTCALAHLLYRYWDVNVTGQVNGNLDLEQPLCGAPLFSVTNCINFNGIDCGGTGPTPPNAAESSALKEVLDGIDPKWIDGRDTTGSRRSSSAPAQGGGVDPAAWIFCPKEADGIINRTMTTQIGRITWIVTCKKDLYGAGVPGATSLFFRVDAEALSKQPILTPAMQAAISNLLNLETLDIRVYDGEFTTSLNALNKLRTLKIYTICMQSTLPSLWFTSWQQLEVLIITKDPAAYSYAPSFTSPRDECGVQGVIPQSLRSYGYSNMMLVDLSRNRLSGSLPDGLINGWGNLKQLNLRDNQLTGPIPADWADDFTPAGKFSIDLSGNKLQVGARGCGRTAVTASWHT